MKKGLLNNGQPIHQRIYFFLRFIFSIRRYNRLLSSLTAYRIEIERRKCSQGTNTTIDNCWFNALNELLEKVDNALERCEIDVGWKCFHAAQRMEIFGLTKEELNLKASLLRRESDKLSSWRKKATVDLLGHADCPKVEITYESVYQAALLRDEHYNNQAYKDGLLRTHIITLFFILFITILVLLIGIIWTDWIPLWFPTCDGRIFVGVALFGLLGGALSAATKVPASTKTTRIPDIVHPNRLTLLRVFMGCASAIVIYVFIQSQFVKDLFNLPFNDGKSFTYYAVSFVSGFSERLVLRAVELVTKEK